MRGLVRDAPSAEGKRPSFEVLVVADDFTAHESLADDLRRQPHSEDAFDYELVFVPSIEDALIAVVVNANLQACLIRPSIEVCSRVKAQVDPSSIAHLVTDLEHSPELSAAVGTASGSTRPPATRHSSWRTSGRPTVRSPT